MTSLVLFPTIYRQLSRPLYDYEGQKVALFTCHYLCDPKSNWLETSEYVYLIPNQHITSKLDWKKKCRNFGLFDLYGFSLFNVTEEACLSFEKRRAIILLLGLFEPGREMWLTVTISTDTRLINNYSTYLIQTPRQNLHFLPHWIHYMVITVQLLEPGHLEGNWPIATLIENKRRQHFS